jgi:hypothetical protein
MKTRKASLLWALLFVLASGPCGCWAACVDLTTLGPYTRWFNERLMARAQADGLIGKPATSVEPLLGPADEVQDYTNGYIISADGGVVDAHPPRKIRTFNYYPYPHISFSNFQVHCTEGIVTGLEMFDD